ncbi:ABC transporter permease [Dermabacteraceae bacterium TAE3-ERU27]|nr:ABC transporter permease [Dermabacteraceae bacterium TAE3-ERU27]
MWKLRARPLLTIITLELRQRVRSRGWLIGLGIWVLFLFLMTALLTAAIGTGSGNPDPGNFEVLYSAITMLVIFMMLVVIPAQTSATINGDRNAGTLATLQATLVSPFEIVVGKTLAGWTTGMVFFGLALPFVFYATLSEQVYPLSVALMVISTSFLMLCITAIGVGLSAWTKRALGSVVLAYLLIVATTFISPIATGLATVAFVSYSEEKVYQWDYSTEIPTCQQTTNRVTHLPSRYTRWLLFPNPYVVISDFSSMGFDQSKLVGDGGRRIDHFNPEAYNILSMISGGVRYLGHEEATKQTSYFGNECVPGQKYVEILDTGYQSPINDIKPNELTPVWQYGAALWTLAAMFSLWGATRRLRTPVKHLPKGFRIA